MTERGYPLSVLYPATMTIYRSLGWEIAGHQHEAVLPARALSAMARPDVKTVGIRRPGPDDAAEVLEVIGRAHAGARDCGPISWDEATMRRWLTRPGWYADTDRYAYLAPDGFLGYRWRRGHEEIFVDRVVAASAATTQALWAVAASNSSVAETVHAQVGPSDPLWWMLREQDANIAERESWMLRLLDAPAAIAARGFPAMDLAVPLQVTDDLLAANSGRWELTVRAGVGRLSRYRTKLGYFSRCPCVARRADAPGAERPGPGRAVRGHAGRNPAPGRPGRRRQPGCRRRLGRRVRRDPVHAGRLLIWPGGRPPQTPRCASRGDDPPRLPRCFFPGDPFPQTPLGRTSPPKTPCHPPNPPGDTPPGVRDPLAADR